MLSIVEHDLRHPGARPAQTLVTLTIDGREVTCPAGTSVMRAAALADVQIPKLCATERSRRSARAACAWCRSRA